MAEGVGYVRLRVYVGGSVALPWRVAIIPGGTCMDRKKVGAWALFDFANSVYPAVMTTAVFPVFYKESVVAMGGGEGEWWWGRAVSVSALIVAVSSPLLGAIADKGGARKKFMAFYTVMCIVGVLMMTTLEAGMIVSGFVFFVVANVGFESSLVFYNAYLPDIAPAEKQGWVSGLGFGLGYLGSAAGLGLAILLVPDMDVVWYMVAAFFALFSVPAFALLPRDEKGEMSIARAAAWGVSSFKQIVADVWQLKELRNFLIAFFFYIDGVLTIIVMAGLVAEETFGFDRQGVIVLFMVLQFSALIGAFLFAKPTDKYGPKKVLNVVLPVWIVAGISAFFIQGQAMFIGMAVVAGLGLGSTQAASRAFMAALIPPGKEAEMFGFYALCGKSSSVLGPALFGWAVFVAGGNQRPGFIVLTALFIIGLVLLQRVKDPRAASGVAASTG